MIQRVVIALVAMLLHWMPLRYQMHTRRQIYGLLTGREKGSRRRSSKAADPPTVDDRFRALLRRRGLSDQYTKKHETRRRGYLGRRYTGVTPTGQRLTLSDGRVAPTFFVQSEAVVVGSRAEADRIEAQNSLKLNELGAHVHASSGLPLVLADPMASIADAVHKGEHLEFDPGSSGVKYESGEVASQEHNDRFIPINLRGNQYDHGLAMQALRESGTLRRGWSTINQILSRGLWTVDPADLGDDATDAEIEAAQEQAEFIRRWQRQLHGGWRKWIREAMYQALAGPSVFVEVWHPAKSERRGMVKKLAFRFPNTIDAWILDDNEQELLGIQFKNPDGTTYVVEARQLLVYSYDSMGTDFEGMGLVRTLFIWIEILQLFSQLEAVAGEKFGSPWVYASKQNPALEHGASDEEMGELEDVINAAIAAENPIITLPDNSKIEITSPAGQMPNFSEPKRFALERINELLKSESSMIGVGATGAFAAREAAASEQTAFAPVFGDILCEGLNGIGSAPYTGTIAKMIDARFGGPVKPDAYPTMSFQLGDFEDPDRVNKIISAKNSGLVQANNEVIEHIHDLLELPPPIFDEIDVPEAGGGGGGPRQNGFDVDEDEDDDEEIAIAATDARLRLADFDASRFGDYLDRVEGRLTRALQRTARAQRAEWEREFAEVRTNQLPVDADAVFAFAERMRQQFLAEYVQAAEGALIDAVNAGGASLRDQLLFESGDPGSYRFPTSADPHGSADLRLKTLALAEEATNRMNGLMVERFTQFARGERETSLPILAESTFAAMAHKAVSTAFNAGRGALMKELNERAERAGIDARTTLAERSAVMDSHTCGQCEQLDGVVVKFGSQRYFDLSPPNKCLGGDRCRCIWSFILPDEDGYLQILESLR